MVKCSFALQQLEKSRKKLHFLLAFPIFNAAETRCENSHRKKMFAAIVLFFIQFNFLPKTFNIKFLRQNGALQNKCCALT